jgi:hypothetical protein
MPAGIHHPVLGYAGFVAVKLAGYSLAAWAISRSYNRPDHNPLIVGGVRTLIGMATGAAYFGLVLALSKSFGGLVEGNLGVFLYMAGLLPLRIAEWWFLLWLFYDRKLEQPAKGWRIVGLGTIWSYVLDLPATLGFLAVGGVWIC